jgi:hypothetical protein
MSLPAAALDITVGAITACAVSRVLDGSLQRLVESAGGSISVWTVVLHGGEAASDADIERALPGGLHYMRRDRVSLSEARNVALADWVQKRAVPDVVCFPDDDCLFEAGTLATVTAAFKQPPVDVVLGAYAPAADRIDRRRFPERAIEVDATFLVRSSSSITIFARTQSVLAAGGFDERLGAGAMIPAGEDTELLLRLKHAGVQLRYEPGALMRHEYKADTGARYHPHAAALLSVSALGGRLPFATAARSVAALAIRVARRRYAPAALRQFARSGRYLCVSSRSGLA